jgi:hypothetical protein
MKKLKIEDDYIKLSLVDDQTYLCLTDMAKINGGHHLIPKWMSTQEALRFLRAWEMKYNADFDDDEYARILADIQNPNYELSVGRWIERTGAVGIKSYKGRSGGTYGHSSIALRFAAYINVHYELLVYEEFEQLKEKLYAAKGWNVRRELSRMNYHIHAEAIQSNLIQSGQTNRQRSIIFASEADMINLVVFEQTAREWRQANPDKKGNIRDHATGVQLTLIANLETHNARLIKYGESKRERFAHLLEIANDERPILEERMKKILPPKR